MKEMAAPFAADIPVCIFDVLDSPPEPVVDMGAPGTEDNNGGFEGSRMMKIDGIYHLFVTERAGLPGRERALDRVRTRLAYWTSTDARTWNRNATLFSSCGIYTEIAEEIAEDHPAAERRCSLWSFIPVFNEEENRWNGFYAAYTCYPNIPPVHCFGRIWRAVSRVPGQAGIGGPYDDVGIVIEPGLSTQPWEGRQAVQYFHPFQINGQWYGLMGGGPPAFVDNSIQYWHVGLAKAKNLSGPWFRLGLDVNPLTSIHPTFVENPLVEKLPNGLLIALFDSGPGYMGLPNQIGYSLSIDGIRWSPASHIPLHTVVTPWWETMRTPLGIASEGDGIYTLLFTAWKPAGRFHPIGMARLKLSPERLEVATQVLKQ